MDNCQKTTYNCVFPPAGGGRKNTIIKKWHLKMILGFLLMEMMSGKTLKLMFALVFSGIIIAGCGDDEIFNTLKRESEYLDPQQDHSVYFPISDSGQDNLHFVDGDDSYYKDIPRKIKFVDNLDGTITDEVTGLVWMKCTMGKNAGVDSTSDCSGEHGEYSWGEAYNACENLHHGGRSDWKLPAYAELFSIIDFGKLGNDMRAIDENYFPNTEYVDNYNRPGGDPLIDPDPNWSMFWTILTIGFGADLKWYWTTSKWGDQGSAHVINFDDGYTAFHGVASKDYHYVRCVANTR